jgi:tetratricopeptide (TPR) repeat protein
MRLRLASLLLLLLLFSLTPAQGDLFRKHYEAANNYHRAGNFAGAEAEFKIILGEAYRRLARVYSAQTNYRGSVEAFESAFAARPDLTDALVDQAIAYFHNGEYQKGIAPLQRAIAANSQNAAAHHMLGKTYFMMGEFDKAER